MKKTVNPNTPKHNPHFFCHDLSPITGEGSVPCVTDKDGNNLTLTQIYMRLSMPFTDDVVEVASKDTTKKGYDSTGIKYQAVVDRYNDVLTPWGWRYDVSDKKVVELRGQSDRIRYEVICDVTITLFPGFDDPYKHSKTHVGSHTSNNRGDAEKGAITAGIKKCSAMFGVGRQAYLGTLDDDNLPVVSERGAKALKLVVKDGFTPNEDDLNGICDVGRTIKGKAWKSLSKSQLETLSTYKENPRAAAIAKEILRRSRIDSDVTNLRLKIGNEEKFTGKYNRLLANYKVKSEYQLSPDDLKNFFKQMEQLNDDLPV